MAKEKTNWVVPTSPADIKEIQTCIQEASNSKLRQEAEKDHITSIFEKVNEKYGMPRRKFNNWLKVYHKQAYANTVADLQEFTDEYVAVMGTVDKSIESAGDLTS